MELLLMRVGIEVGGTFTDLVVFDGKNTKTAKVPSTPANPDKGAMLALEAAGLRLEEITELNNSLCSDVVQNLNYNQMLIH